MRTLALIALLLIQPCFARAEWPYEASKPAASWPFKPCDCNPCICNPLDCNCANCAAGCRKAGAASAADVTYSVGAVDIVDPFNVTPTVQAPIQTYHTEYRQVCNGRNCQMVAVTVADQPQVQGIPPGPYYPKTYTAGSICPCCGMVMTAEQAARAASHAPVTTMAAPVMMAPIMADSMTVTDDGSVSVGRTGPVRRIIGRIFRGRRGGGCGG